MNVWTEFADRYIAKKIHVNVWRSALISTLLTLCSDRANKDTQTVPAGPRFSSSGPAAGRPSAHGPPWYLSAPFPTTVSSKGPPGSPRGLPGDEQVHGRRGSGPLAPPRTLGPDLRRLAGAGRPGRLLRRGPAGGGPRAANNTLLPGSQARGRLTSSTGPWGLGLNRAPGDCSARPATGQRSGRPPPPDQSRGRGGLERLVWGQQPASAPAVTLAPARASCASASRGSHAPPRVFGAAGPGLRRATPPDVPALGSAALIGPRARPSGGPARGRASARPRRSPRRPAASAPVLA
ncbi:collagen alpha-1(I) chain-like [Perognathus longimembris pacificus]|uniref:collagen alpha-1(I) chain-like n=1 Tax=Perognathus longimembris pacificus TaxID=214514 RepID=UPI002018BC86|nr:collagen alpha-1(I) chain-like [Perognathus longimembris pacificus]